MNFSNIEYRLLYKQAALDFLTNISFDGLHEEVKTSNVRNINQIHNMENTSKEEVYSKKHQKISGATTEHMSITNKLLSKRMFENICNRKRRTTSSSSTSSISDDKVINVRLKCAKQRLIIVSPGIKIPFSIYSILPFNKRSKFVKPDGLVNELMEAPRLRLMPGVNPGVSDETSFGLISILGEEDVSYQHLLKPIIYQENKSNLINIPSKSSKPLENYKYDPSLLDDPEMINSRNKVILHLPNYLTTIINYVRPVEMKTDINEQFRQKFPEIKLTLSKLRGLKGNILSVAKKIGIDLWTVANAFVYFETLILKSLVTKNNRKLCCAVSLILSAKINDIKGSELTMLLQELENIFKIHRREIFQYEIYVFVALEFGLLSCDKAVNVHHKRLLLIS